MGKGRPSLLPVMAALVALVVLVAGTPSVAAAQGGAAPADAYVDAESRELVRLARERRLVVDRRITSYEATALERISLGLRMGIGERLLYRRDTATRIEWTPDTVRIAVLGAREVMPPVNAALQVPAGLSGYVPALAFDPVDSEMLLRFDTTVIRHPLSAGSESHYRFAAGDSTVITLPDGRAVKLRELRIAPRRADPQLISGSFWLDAGTHAVVQAYFRLGGAFDSRRDGSGGGSLLPRPAVRAELDYIAIDYGYWDFRWWLPRTVAARGLVQVAGVRMPLSYERRYDGYTVTGDTTPPVVDATAALEPRPCRPRTTFTAQARVGSAAAADTTVAADTIAGVRRVGRAGAGAAADSATICDRAFIVTQPPAGELLAAALFTDDIYAGSSAVIDAGELRAITERVRSIPGAPWRLQQPVLQWGAAASDLLRYNRVEGLAVGARAVLELGAAAADAELRLGTASGEVGAAAGLARAGALVDTRLAAYRRLDVADVANRPFSFGSSASALLLGRDDHDYFRATGGELRLRPAAMRRQWYDLRLFAEAQRAVDAAADFHVSGLLGAADGFRENMTADAAQQYGAAVRLRAARGTDPAALRLGAELELHGEAGDYAFARPSLRLRATAPLPLPGLSRTAAFGLELAGGSSFGDPPAQRLWQLGGAATLRGYDAAAARGDSFWRGRAEVGTGMAFARAALFMDAGWAGPRDGLLQGRPLQSAGIGISLLDGLLRLDLAHALQRQRGWRLHLQLDSVL
jgi:hypothetical protein